MQILTKIMEEDVDSFSLHYKILELLIYINTHTLTKVE